jgi:fructokinase
VILVAGEALIDLLVSSGGAITAVPGGGPFNVARALARLGCRTGFLGELSSDGFGQELRRALVGDGVSLVIDKPIDAPTTLAVGRLDAFGAASYGFYLAGTSAALLMPDSVPAAVFDGVTGLHVGSLGLAIEPMASTVRQLVAQAPTEVLAMVDVNARPAAIVDLAAYRVWVLDQLRRADIVKVSTEDLEVVLPEHSAPEAAQILLAAGAGVVLVTEGPHPVRVYGAAFHAEVAAPDVVVVDTVGAGDAFGAGFLAWWLRHEHGREALGERKLVVEATARAVEIAALTCTRRGADPPRLADLPATW